MVYTVMDFVETILSHANAMKTSVPGVMVSFILWGYLYTEPDRPSIRPHVMDLLKKRR
jgi:hypothetical protein